MPTHKHYSNKSKQQHLRGQVTWLNTQHNKGAPS
jgi:hypothetical protein